MKVLKDKYPKGTWPYQKSDGRYIDGYLHDNLSIMADAILKDMTFLGVIFSSTLEVGTGKSVLATQIGEIWSEIMKDKHNIDVPFGLNNIVWRPKELIERSFQVPKYSYVLLDEWEDAHYWSELGMTLRKFFRKCRQLNLFIMIIIPNWFQLPLPYAVSRSVFAIDVKFGEAFDRGYFDFYGFEAKKNLYIKGKKFHSYHVQRPDFDGVFNDGYGVSEADYRKKKLEDMQKWDEEEQKPKVDVETVRRDTAAHIYNKLKGKITIKDLAEVFAVTTRSIRNWVSKEKLLLEGGVSVEEESGSNYNKDTINKGNLSEEEEEQSKEETDSK